MEQTQAKNTLGTRPIKPLLLSLAWPAILANLINAFYNVVDQIFIGQGVGFLGNAATNVAFPITTICLAIGLMVGLGAASGFNLELGKNNPHNARHIAGSAVGSLLIAGVILCVVINIWLTPLLNLFGATDQILSYAKEYTSITAFGIPFYLFSIGINPLVRADSSPTYSLLAIAAGAICNTILDPIFIFGFGMGMAGAAWATVIGQVLSAVILALYFPRFKAVKFSMHDFIPQLDKVLTICSLGMSSFIFQFSMLVVQITTNLLLKNYGTASIYGSEIPIAVAGVVAKINTIFLAIIIGLVQGAQPIFSFNYGAQRYSRVRETLALLLKVNFAFSVICFAVFELFPQQIILIFGSGSDLYYEFAVKYMRVVLFFTFINGIQTSCSTFFASIGKAKKGALLAFTKQLLLLVPLLIIMSSLFGLDGLIFATPISDFCSFALAGAFLWHELKHMPATDGYIS